MGRDLKTMLVERRYLVSHYPTVDEEKENIKRAYLNAYLLSNFGIVVDKPQLLTEEMVEDISKVYMLEVPASFYSNPQDMKYFTKAELLIEQLVSYFLVETGTGIYNRVEIFEKDLPEYKVGNEIKLREFKVIYESDTKAIYEEIAKAYCDYTRPFSQDELEEFILLFENGSVLEDYEIKCRDNIFALLKYDIRFARLLDKKDLVKMSLSMVGEKHYKLAEALKAKDETNLIGRAIPYVRGCQMTKRQTKYFNKLVQVYKADPKKAATHKSPYMVTTKLLQNGDVLGAAREFARNGSLLERNLRMLLSRANPEEAVEIINMLPAKNPMVLFQLVSSLGEEAGNSRIFTFYKNGLVKKHRETDYETKWRKSRISSGTIKFLHDKCLGKIFEYYRGLPTVGKVYIDDIFYNIGIPTNTSASGRGIDTLPAGSRMGCTGSAIRTFVTWKGVYDIDASMTAFMEDGRKEYMYFGNYSSKPFGNALLFSGDDRSSHGTEYYDCKLDDLKARGVKYLVQSFHGFNGRLDQGEIYCGYQNKEDLNTRAWDPKNVETQFRVRGDSRACIAFAIDVKARQVVFLNLMVADESQVVNAGNSDNILKYLQPSFLELNIGAIAECRGERVDTPEEADLVFSDSYKTPTENQKVIHTYDLEKLVSFANN